MAEIPTSVPATITAGDTLKWRTSLADYPADAGWTLKYRLINSANKYDITAAADGSDYLVAVAATISAAYAPGVYTWQAYVEKGTDRYTTGSGSLTINPDLAAQAAGYDTRSHARKTLAAIEAWIESHDPGVADYQIAGRSMRYIHKDELLALRSRYQNEVRREEAAERISNGLAAGNRLLVRL